MFVLTEGAPHSGVTTFGHHLAELTQRHGGRVVTLSPPPGADLPDYEALEEFRPLALSPRDLLLLDHWHLTEVTTQPNRLGTAQTEHLDLYLETLGVTRILVRPTPTDLAARTRPEEATQVFDTLTRLLRFTLAARRHRWHTVDAPAPDSTTRDAYLQAGINAHRARTLAAHPLYLGPPAPDTLVVHEAAAPAPAPAPAPAVLLAALARHTRPARVGVISDTAPDLPALYEALSAPRVLAWGAHAAQTLQEANLPFTPLTPGSPATLADLARNLR